ncbi:MAG: helix-turn-helix transcriptional regulator, partial [Geobacter sp.]|nr:helix-turn-helix transcriptional regulator [Geobacter sp.]
MKKETRIGIRIRNMRLRKQLSLEDAAKEAGISQEMLAGIEEMAVAPPLGVIASLARLFKVSVGDIFGESGDSPFCIVRSSNREAVARFGHAGGNSGGYCYESLGQQKQNRQMEPFMVTLTPVAGDQPVEPNQHAGE